MNINFQLIICSVMILAFSVIVPAQSGGVYAVMQTVVAGGGGQNSAGGTYAVDGTIGQPITGTISNGSVYSVKGGFWAAGQPGPTAAAVSVSGRVLMADGRGIRGVVVTMTDAGGTVRRTLSSAFGYFNFEEVPAGATYIFTAAAKRFTFSQPTQVFSITADLNEITFVEIPTAH